MALLLNAGASAERAVDRLSRSWAEGVLENPDQRLAAAMLLLVQRGLPIEWARNKAGRTPLGWAVEAGAEGEVAALLALGASLKSQGANDFGRGSAPRAVVAAVEGGHAGVLSVLLAARGAEACGVARRGGELLELAHGNAQAVVGRMACRTNLQSAAKRLDGGVCLLIF
jgi:hypothetical protein